MWRPTARVFCSLLAVGLLCAAAPSGEGHAGSIRTIKGGQFVPLYGGPEDGSAISVDTFRLDEVPVTNEQYWKFIRDRREWDSSRRGTLLADVNYLAHWNLERGEGPAPSPDDLLKPVTQVSWFAAQAFCESRGGRLPTVVEWEYAAAADEKKPDASRDPAFVQRILEWYSKPGTVHRVGSLPANYWGVRDLHGNVWEWTYDFNSVFVSSDNRRLGEAMNNLFCGASATTATDRANYAAFMRYALRSSLEGHFTTANLGFRCAYDN